MMILKKIIKKIYRQSKYKYRDLRGGMGLDNRFYENARGARMLIYHGICQRAHTRFNTLFLKLKTFESHLQFYKRYFNILSVDDYFNGRFSKDRFNICLTFDDGFANNYKYVLPLLQRYKVPAAFFITAIRGAGYDILWNDFLAIASRYGPERIAYKNEVFHKNKYAHYISGQTGNYLKDILRSAGFAEKAEMMQVLAAFAPCTQQNWEPDYWLQMTVDQIRDLSRSELVTIGGHGYYHNDLAKLDIQLAAEEIASSKQYIENIIAKKITALAFPYGSYSRALVMEAKNAGYNQLLAMDYYFPEDKRDEAIQERFAVNPFISVQNQMFATVTGRYE